MGSDQELVDAAAAVLNPQMLDDHWMGNVACAIESTTGEVFTGVCIGGRMGICAEQSAVSNMISKMEPRIRKIVAVWKDLDDVLFVLPPCGRCREFLQKLEPENLDADVIMGRDHVEKLRDLLPYASWYSEKA